LNKNLGRRIIALLDKTSANYLAEKLVRKSC